MILLVFLYFYIIDRSSFTVLNKWLDDVRNERGQQAVIMIVGNKTDLADKREVSAEEGEEFATKEKTLFIECSAKAGFNIKALFKKVASVLPGVNNTEEVQDKRI